MSIKLNELIFIQIIIHCWIFESFSLRKFRGDPGPMRLLVLTASDSAGQTSVWSQMGYDEMNWLTDD